MLHFDSNFIYQNFVMLMMLFQKHVVYTKLDIYVFNISQPY